MNHRLFAARNWLAGLIVVTAAVLRAGAQTTLPASRPDSETLRFNLTYDSAIAESFTGRVYVMFGNPNDPHEPRLGPNWFNPKPFFALDVSDWKPDTSLVFDDGAIAFPAKLSAVRHDDYAIQAVMRLNCDSPEIGSAAGNGYSPVVRLGLRGADGTIDLRIDQVVTDRAFHETAQIKLVEFRSSLLSDFHKRDVIMRAAVVLPASYGSQTERRFPALYWIGGFGSTHDDARSVAMMWRSTGYEKHIVRVVLDPSCYGGHHAFADSDNNGPRGKALIEEFIPHLEQTFRVVAAPSARFLTGHSSGGWSSLWLQVTYPDFFGGVWSVAPDPVDFRDFQRINLYEPGVNMYSDQTGGRRPLARRGHHVMIWYEDFAKMDVVHGEGGQLRSFEWVFSPRGPDGLPKPLYDRNSGAVDPNVAARWKRYDIRAILEENWTTLGPKLKGKLHVFMGEIDTFYLDGATRLLKESQENLGSDAVIEIEPGKDHGTIATPLLYQRIDRELMDAFRKAHPDLAPPVTTYD